MADVNSNININFNTTAALAQLRSLQAGLSKFHQSLAEGNLAAANAQKGLNAQLLQSIGATGKFSASQVKVAGSTLAFTSALEKNKLSLREYYRYTMAAATANTRVMGKAFAQEREIINRARRDRVKALQAQYIQMNKANAGFMDSIRIMPKSLAMAGGKFTELGTRIQYAAQRQQFLNQLLKQGSTQLLNFGKNTQWAGRQLMVGLTMPLALFGASAAKTFKELEVEIVKFKRVYGNAFTNAAETDAAVENIRRLATEYTKYGVSVTKTMEMAATAAAAGFTGNALNTQVETATKLSVLGQVEQQQALETTISLQSAFGLSTDELAKKIDFLNAVENQTLLSIEDLTIAIPKAAPVIKQLGGNVEDLAFFMTAMKEGGINASEGANALKSGLASLINPSKKAAGFLADLGINVQGIVEANKGDIKATVVGFAQALDTLDPLNRARAIEQMFGKFQFARLSTLFQNVTKEGTQASRALDLASSSIEELAVLSEREMKKIEDSVGVKFQAAIEQFKQEIMPLGKVFLEALTPVVKFFGGLFEKFNGLGDNTKKVIAIIVGAVAGLGPILLMTFGLLANGLANVIKFFAMLRGGIAKLNGQTSVMGAGFTYMTQEQIESAAASQQLHQTHTRLIEVFNVENASVNALAASYNSLSTQMRSMAAQNPALFAGGMGGAKRAVTKLPPVKKYAEGILSVPGPKGAGDVIPAMLSPGEAVIPTKTTDKYRGLITAMFQDKVPGFMAGRLPGGPGRGIPLSAGPAAVRNAQQAKYRRRDDARQGYNEPHPEKKSGPTFIGMPKSASEASQSRQILDKISNSVKAGRFADVPPTDFGTMLQSFSGRSFPARGVGGVYRKPNGQIVVVKPTMDDKTALAEVRATQIAREVHGLVSPRQTIKTMMDPTDPTGQRKFIVIESPYDPRIASMSGKFSKTDMVKQLVASTLRGDKDLQKPNLSGNVLADVGTAGVFDRASGFRDFAKVMPSMEQQAIVNLLGVKGGAKKFFAQETSSVAASMTPSQYDAAIKKEISGSIPRLEKVIKSFDLDPTEQIEYAKMLERLKAGAKTDWAALHPMHVRAGDGIQKLEVGNFDKFKNVPESKTQIDILTRRLSEDAVKEFKKLPEEQRERVLSALRKQKPAATEAMSQSKMIKFVEENMIYKDGLFHDKKSLDAGRETAGKTYEQVMKKVFYQMGLAEKDGQFVSNEKINKPSRLRDAMSPEGKAGGGWRTNVPKDSLLWKALDQEEQRFRAANMAAGSNDPLKAVREKLSALGYNEKQIARELRSELSHVEKTGESGRGPAKYLKGSAMFDLRILNNFMNTKARHQKILDWNAKNGYPLIPENQVGSYAKAATFMGPGSHPTTLAEIKLVQKAAQLDVIAENYLKQQKTKPKGFPNLGKVNASRGVLALLNDRIGTGYYNSSQPVFNLASGPDKTQKVLVDPRNEFKVDTVTGKITKLTVANTGAKPAGAFPDSGSSRDTRTTTESGTQRVATRSQARRFGRMFAATPGFSMPGKINGDPRLGREVSNPTVRQGEIASQMRRAGYSQEEIDKTIRKIQKRELEAKQAAAQSSEKEARAKQQQAETQRRQTDAARKRFLENERRAELNRQMALNYDAAVKEDRDRTLRANKQTQKEDLKNRRMARQQKIGGISGGASMALGTAGMGLMMAGQQTAGMAAMGASAVAGLAPMFAQMSKAGGIATGVVAVGASLYLLNKHLENAAKKQAAYVDSVSATTSKMEKIGQITNKVGASRAMDEVRKKGVFGAYNDVERAGTGFGDTFLTSEIGKSMVDGFVNQMKTSGSEGAAKDFALQLSSYVSDGVLDASQAADIADQIGIQLGSRKYTAEIMGNLRSVIGPNGEDLANNPLRVRMQIVEESGKRSSAVLNRLDSAVKSGKSGNTEAAQLAALGVNNIEIAKAQADATEFQYKKQIQLLEKEIESTTNAEKILSIKEKIATLEGDMARDVTVANRAVSDRINKEVSLFDKNIRQREVGFLSGSKEDAYFDSLKSKVKDTYKGTEFESMATDSLSRLAKVSDLTTSLVDGGKTKGGFKDAGTAQQFEVQMSLLLANKVLNPEQLNTFMQMFEGKLPELGQTLSIGIKTHGAAGTVEMLDYFTTFEKQDKAVEISAKILKSNPKQFKEIGEAMAQLRVLDGHEVNMEAFITTVGYDGLLALSQDLAKIEAMPDKLDKELILKYFTTGKGAGVAGASKENLEVLFAQWEDFDKLPDKAQKEAISKFTTIYQTIFKDEAARLDYAKRESDAAARESGFRGRTAGAIKKKRFDEIMSGTLSEAQAAEAARKTEEYIGQNGELVVKSPVGGSTGGGGTKSNPLAFLDDLAMQLKQVRSDAFNALTPLESILEAFTNKSTAKDAFNLLDGIQNRLLRMGTSEGLRDVISSMSAKEFDEVANLTGEKALFTFQKGKPKSKATITGLTETGKAVDETYRKLDIGAFNLQNEELSANIKNQATAYNILTAAGLTASQALEAVQVKGLAAALAAGSIKKGDKDWDVFIDNLKTSNAELDKQAVLNKAIKANEDFKFQQNAVEFAKSFYDAGLSIEQIDEILSDPQLTAYLVEDLKDGKIAAGEIKDYIDSIPKRVTIDINQKLAKKDFLGAAAPGLEIVDKMFEIQETLIRIAGKATTKPIQDNIDKQEALIRALQKEEKERLSLKDILDDYTVSYDQLLEKVKEYQKTVDDAQRDLEVNSDYGSRVIDALNENINDLNREIEMDPDWGTRAVESLQDESGVLSNDLEVMNNAAEKINEQYDKQAEALQKVSDINQNIVDQQKEQIDLADALTQGDIASAARAAQQMRQTSASQYTEGMSNAIEQSRTNAIEGLTNSKGMSKKKIEERQFEIAQKIYAMENDPERVKKAQAIKDIQDSIYAKEELREKKLLDIQAIEDKIYAMQQEIAKDDGLLDKENKKLVDLNTELSNAEKSIQKQLDNIKVMGKDKDGWDLVKTKLEAYNLALDKTVNEKMAALTKATAAVEADWESINGWLDSWLGSDGSVINLETIHTITYVYSGSPGPGSGGAGGDAYVAPQDTPESIAEAETFDATVERLDAAQAALDAILSEGSSAGGQRSDDNYDIRQAQIEAARKELAEAQAAYDAIVNTGSSGTGGGGGGGRFMQFEARGGLINPMKFALGGYAKGTDTVPAMLTPGEFVMSKYAVESHGIDTMKAINSGKSTGAVYNNTYTLTVNAKTDANPNEIAQAVMSTIRQVDDRRIRGVSLNGR